MQVLAYLMPNEHADSSIELLEAQIRDVLEERREHCIVEGSNTLANRNSARQLEDRMPAPLIFPGAFNPLHRGHALMAAHAKQRFGSPVDFELSVANVDKATLSVEDVIERLRQFPEARIWITRAATFLEKAKLFPNCRFVLGADTAVRLFDQKYYTDANALAEAITAIDKQGCRFVVFGRKISERFVNHHQLGVPDSANHLFDWVTEEDFRVDVSSTEIRSKRNS